MQNTIRIATRESPLALWQSEHVRERLQKTHPGLRVELLPMTTKGDQLLSHSLSRVGGKGLFVKELELALLDGRADIAVHSMKDMPAEHPPELAVIALLASDDPRDAFVSNEYASLDALPAGAVVGTASLRRQALLRHYRPDLQVREVRGNVGSRLKRLDDGQFDALILACAGLRRLGLEQRIAEALPPERFVPAPGQGVVGIQGRRDDQATISLMQPLLDANSDVRLSAERAMSSRLGGACHVPVAGHAVINGQRMSMQGLVANPDGTQLIRDAVDGEIAEAEQLGARLATQLLAAGGREILVSIGVMK